ncbi:hypothetical protein MGEO_02995 [Marivita geojedonensis]|uniref:Oligosaccharide repeat unit polymerase n=1 Tax=Marivita geojedonensis TaxID=1123756 RepID=A0A1X4NRI7_9RHOB|nr:hypothetical protein MGEO_02995 [Marivita geojedonensis]
MPAHRSNNLKLISTFILLFSLVTAWMSTLIAENADQAFSNPAFALAVGLVVAFFVEGQTGVRNLLRIDLFMLGVLYLLTFLEFLLPQRTLLGLVSLNSAQTAVTAVLLGFAGIVLGRHAFPVRQSISSSFELKVSPNATVRLMIVCAVFGYLYMLIAVRFDIFELFYQLTRPRFSQPWARGRFGSLSTLLNELALLKYLIPPLAAAILANRKKYYRWQILIAMVLLSLVLFESFASGTRNVFLSHLATFISAYALMKPRMNLRKLALVFAPIATVAYFAIYYLPEIRNLGLQNFGLALQRTDSLFVDMNMVNVAHLTEVFPERAGYLGFEIPYIAAIRPVPRALWPGKPEGLSLGIEEALGVQGMTLSATFVGEFWMAGGYIAILLASLFLGAMAALWNRRGARAATTFDVITFALGFFAAGIAMRSYLSVFPTLLPIFAIILHKKFKIRS